MIEDQFNPLLAKPTSLLRSLAFKRFHRTTTTLGAFFHDGRVTSLSRYVTCLCHPQDSGTGHTKEGILPLGRSAFEGGISVTTTLPM